MGLINCASWYSQCEGLDYYEAKRVLAYKKVAENVYTGKVKGTEVYDVTIDILHPRRSSCTCPHAIGRRIVCKHQIALYFKAIPSEAIKFKEDVKRQEEEYQEYEEQLRLRLEKYLNKLPKADVIQILMNVVDTSPEWVYDNLIRHTIGWR